MEMRVFGFKNWNRLPSNHPGSSYLHRQLCPALILPQGRAFFVGRVLISSCRFWAGSCCSFACLLEMDIRYSTFSVPESRTPYPRGLLPGCGVLERGVKDGREVRPPVRA